MIDHSVQIVPGPDAIDVRTLHRELHDLRARNEAPPARPIGRSSATGSPFRVTTKVSPATTTAITFALSLRSSRYQGDSDWPGIAIARRIIMRGTTPWRMGHDDYLEATTRLPADHRLALTGRSEATPRDERLQAVMMATDVAVHEEALVDVRLADLGDVGVLSADRRCCGS